MRIVGANSREIYEIHAVKGMILVYLSHAYYSKQWHKSLSSALSSGGSVMTMALALQSEQTEPID